MPASPVASPTEQATGSLSQRLGSLRHIARRVVRSQPFVWRRAEVDGGLLVDPQAVAVAFNLIDETDAFRVDRSHRQAKPAR